MICYKNKKVLLHITRKAVFVVFLLTLASFANASAGDSDIEDIEYKKLMETYTNDKYYNDVCWLTSHNSFAYYDPLFSNKVIASNQWFNIKEQLKYGVRGFMVDLYYEDDDPKNTIVLAHRFSSEPAIWNRRYYKQDFSAPFLVTIKEWLNANPQDIITIHLESYIRSYEKIMEEINRAGLSMYLFDLCEYNKGRANPGDPGCFKNSGHGWTSRKYLELDKLKWPTLGEMRNSNKRLIIFSDKSEDAGYGIMHVSNTMETKYNLSEFPTCEKRSEGRRQIVPIFIMNHFYKYMAVPVADLVWGYSKANHYDTLLLRSGACCLKENKCPNFIAIDNVGLDGNGDRQIVSTINEHNAKCRCTEQYSLLREPKVDIHRSKKEANLDL